MDCLKRIILICVYDIDNNCTEVYNYDNRGNILTVSKSDVLFQQYVYDEASQVKAEYNYAEKTAMTYVYDTNGNIVSKTPYTNVTCSDLSTATQGTAIVYGYGDSNWSDKLTSYDGQTITYDASGNPTSYRGETVTWNGRLMTSFTKDDRRYEYSYNSDGMRTVKKVYKNNELVYTYTYIWDGDVLLAGRMEVTDADEPITIRYLYDDSGELYGMDYNGNGYYGFIKNLQGDIVSIVPLDFESNVELNMEYDAWGKPIFEESSLGAAFVKAMIMAATNVGYRGYFYDFEIGLYYLRSRYYDPEIGRFINADDTDYLGYDDTPLSMNLFAYCENNTVNNSDHKGTSKDYYKNYIFVYNNKETDFYAQAHWMSKYAYNNKNVIYIYIVSKEDFKREWNKLKGKKILDIHLFIHGDKDKLYFKGVTMTGTEVSKLSKLSMKGKLYLYACHGGTIVKGTSIAMRLAKLVADVKVKAVVNGSVYYTLAHFSSNYRPICRDIGAYWATIIYISKIKKYRIQNEGVI